MPKRILYVERKASSYVSIEKAFRGIAENLSSDFSYEFQQAPFGTRIWHTLCNLLLFRKRAADVYHITGGIHYLALLFSPRNTVLSIMDVRFMYNESGIRYWLLKKLYLDWPIRRLKYITAISEQTKAEIVQYSGCESDKIRVLELPLLVKEVDTETSSFNADLPTILQVGTMPNKNVPNLARALRRIRAKLRLIGPLGPDLVEVLEENGVQFENVENLTDEEIRNEYRNADIVTFCSLFEGFGLPIIEAQSTGIPVITSNLSPMIETSGGAAILVDPNDVQEIRAAILRLIGEPKLRMDLVNAGIQNIERFTPRKVTEQYEDLYREILRSQS